MKIDTKVIAYRMQVALTKDQYRLFKSRDHHERPAYRWLKEYGARDIEYDGIAHTIEYTVDAHDVSNVNAKITRAIIDWLEGKELTPP